MIKPNSRIQFLPEYKVTKNRNSIIRMDLNENLMGCSQIVLDKLRQLTSTNISSYPEYTNLTEQLSGYLSVGKNKLILTNGLDDAIKLICDVYIEEGDETLILDPTFSMYSFYAKMAGSNVIPVQYDDDFSFPMNQLLDSINKKTKLIFIANPNNPTGTSILKLQLFQLLENTKDCLVVLDEAYVEFITYSAIQLLYKYPNLLILRTFSKCYGLAGLRIGYIVGNEVTTNYLRKGMSPFSVNSIACIGASAALNDQNSIREYVRLIEKNRESLSIELRQLGFTVVPSKANFILVKFGVLNSYINRGLSALGIKIRQYNDNPILKFYSRITIGSQEENDTLLKCIIELLDRPTLLFDMDGVLVDVSQSYRIAIKNTSEYFSNSNVSLEDIELVKLKGGFNNDWDATEQILLDKNVKIEKDQIINKFQEYYLGVDSNEGLIDNEEWLLSVEKLEPLFDYYRIGIVTGRPKKEVEYTLNKFEVSDLFDVLITMDDYPPSKSKPNSFPIELALGKLKSSSGLYFGDSIDDMQAVSTTDLIGVGISVNLENKDLLINSGASYILSSINQIREVL